MAEPTIICPNCATEIRLTELLAAPLIAETRREMEARVRAARAETEIRTAALETERAKLAEDRRGLDAEVAGKVAALRAQVAAEEAARARAALGDALEAKSRELAELSETLRARDEKLKAAQEAQAEALRQTRALEDARRELDLTVEIRVAETLGAERARARAEAEEGLKLKVAEKEEKIAAMARQIEALKQRAEQGSQQLQGEALELELEAAIRAAFPLDGIEPVAKGDSGADVVQRVLGPAGQSAGAILWESKRTRNWSDGWLAKLRADQRANGAEVAILVSQALPGDIDSFGQIDGVWVCAPGHALPLALVLRQSLVEIAKARAARDGQGDKMELVYDYLTGPRFRHRIEAIVERITDMSADLDRERKAMTRLWAKRDAQIRGVVEATVGMYGDLQGIAGTALREIEGLDLPLLDSPDDD